MIDGHGFELMSRISWVLAKWSESEFLGHERTCSANLGPAKTGGACRATSYVNNQ